MSEYLYDYWPIVERPPLTWPEGRRLAFYVALNVEYFELGKPSTALFAATAELPVDPLNHGWRDYGARVGIWRTIDVLDAHDVRASVLLNSDVCVHHPQIVAAGKERNWAWCGHGRTNSQWWTGLELDDERAAIAALVEELTEQTGRPPRGWLAPALTETVNTPGLLADSGFTYILDWCCDDQPFPLKVGSRRMISIPYAIEVNDIVLFLGAGMTGDAFAQIATDNFDTLYAEARRGTGSVMCLSIHPFIIGQPFRIQYLERVLSHVQQYDDVWITTSDDIADWYFKHHYDEAVASRQRPDGAS